MSFVPAVLFKVLPFSFIAGMSTLEFMLGYFRKGEKPLAVYHFTSNKEDNDRTIQSTSS